jgi:hypothetical protein
MKQQHLIRSKKISVVLILLAGTLTIPNHVKSAHEIELAAYLEEHYYGPKRLETCEPATSSWSIWPKDMICTAIGAPLRTAGDYIRTSSNASPSTSPPQVDLASLGNALRYAGSLFVGETPTPERTIIQFWSKVYPYMDRPDIVIPSTVATLFSLGKSIDVILSIYRAMMVKIIQRGAYPDFTTYGGEILNGYFVYGLISGFARAPIKDLSLEGFQEYLCVSNIELKSILKIRPLQEKEEESTGLTRVFATIHEEELCRFAYDKLPRTTTAPLAGASVPSSLPVPEAINTSPSTGARASFLDPARPLHERNESKK